LPTWVFFDVDQTLCDFEASLRRAVASTVDEIRRRHPGAAADHLTDADLHEARDRVAATAGPATSMEQIRYQSLAAVLERVDPHATTADVDTIAAFYFDARFDRPNLYPETIDTLEVLSCTGYRLGIISNGNSYPRHLGLHRFFTEVLLSTDVGLAKPDPAIDRLAAERVGRTPADLVMVGDSQVNDVDAAIAAGWRAVRLDRAMTTARTGTASSPVIANLAELPAVLAAM
jgi:FMN hydrolase / 5-amino-6-(5-phospho-D-ribitylamino)uracil phosphatase